MIAGDRKNIIKVRDVINDGQGTFVSLSIREFSVAEQTGRLIVCTPASESFTNESAILLICDELGLDLTVLNEVSVLT